MKSYRGLVLSILFILTLYAYANEPGTLKLFGWEEEDGVTLNTDGSWDPPAGYGGAFTKISTADASEGTRSSRYDTTTSWEVSGLISGSLGWSVLYRNPKVLRTSGWHPLILGSDWSGYPKLWIDIKAEKANAKISVQIEDDMTPYPQSMERVYDVPGGEWVTVEYDLKSAEDNNLLDLGKIISMYVVVKGLSAFSRVYMDNVRLAEATAVPSRQLITDASPWIESFEPPSYNNGLASRPSPFIPDMIPDRTALSSSEGIKTVSTIGGNRSIAAYDNNIIGTIDSPNMRTSINGGDSWSGFSVPTSQHSHHNGDAAFPGEVMGAYLLHCSGGGSPSMTYFYRTYFDGTQWKQGPYDVAWKDLVAGGTKTHKAAILDFDVRHCQQDRMDIVRLPSGRIWAAWDHYNRYGSATNMYVHAKYSDDNGLTWQTAGFRGDIGRIKYSGEIIKLSTLGFENAAIFYTYNSQWYFSWCNQAGIDSMYACYAAQNPSDKIPWERFMTISAWSPPALLNATFQSATSTLDGKLYVAVTNPSKILVWTIENGWQASLDNTTGMLTRCGDNTVLLFTDGSFRYKNGDNSWSSAENVPNWTGTSLNMPEISPPNFVPLAWGSSLYRFALPSNVPVSQTLRIGNLLPDGIFNEPYSAKLTALSGNMPYTWSLISGTLPSGLSLNSAGNITGTPTTEGVFTFQVQVTDNDSNTDAKELTLAIQALSTGIKQSINLNPFYFYSFPNPFNQQTVINYQLSTLLNQEGSVFSHVSLKIYDIRGKLVKTLVNKKQAQGIYAIKWNAAQIAPGVYFANLNSKNMNFSRKLLILR